ncbi:MAG: DUF99 family protein [Candidatus Bathyarchaeia archaeon]
MNHLKSHARLIGISPGDRRIRLRKKAFIGVISRGSSLIEGIIKGEAEWNGDDATERIADSITSSPYYEQIRCIFLEELHLAGGNKIDMRELYRITRIPVVLVIRPGFPELLENNPREHLINMGHLNFFTIGFEEGGARDSIKASLGDRKIPEALVVARKIATAYNDLLRRKVMK